MSNIKKSRHDMSIEEILKSIRGIIDNHNPDAPRPKHVSNEVRDEDILELTQIADKQPSEPMKELHTNASTPGALNEPPLISAQTIARTSQMFKDFSEQAAKAVNENKKTNPLSIEELVIDMMKPQLSRWLDENLPNLVNQQLEKEIKRLIPGK